MKFINTNTNFQSKKNPYPTYLNSYARDGKIEIGENAEYLSIQYLFCHQIPNEFGKGETKEVVINRSNLRFTDFHIPTTIQNENQEEVEVYQFILEGETYDKAKIMNWGKPSIHKVFLMFELESLVNGVTGIVLKDLTEISIDGEIHPISEGQAAQIKQLMIDWLKETVIIENEKLGVNFELEEI